MTTIPHNPQRLYFYQAFDGEKTLLKEYLFWTLEDALDQLRADEMDYDLSYTPTFETQSKFVILLPSPKQLRRLTKRGVELCDINN